MLRTLARVASTIGLLTVMAATQAQAGAADGAEAQAVIVRQLDAFQRGDAEGAFALASPTLRESFSDSDQFMSSIRSKEKQFFHRRVTEFSAFMLDGDAAAQSVVLVDDDSDVWNVVYKLARQPDGSWLIDGVVLIEANATDA